MTSDSKVVFTWFQVHSEQYHLLQLHFMEISNELCKFNLRT